MQAFFARKKSFIPNSSVLSVFVGAHFTGGTQNFLKQFLAINPEHFKDKEIGCRDDFTLEFCKNLGLKSYLSRCLTLTLPRRKNTNSQNKIFLVNIPDSYLQYLPKDLLQNAERINQKSIKSTLANEKEFYEQTKALLRRYENEAKLVIATALHCASPCTAMGIPVVLIADNYNEQKTRFGALKGILKIHTLQDLQEQKVDFNIKAPDIEELKGNMLENLKLSIAKVKGEKVDEQRLVEIRNKIENFNVL